MSTAIDPGATAPPADGPPEAAPGSSPQPATAAAHSRGAGGNDPTPKKASTKMATKNNNRDKREPSAEAVLSRARRIARKELRPIAAMLGVEEFDNASIVKALKEKLEAVTQQPATPEASQQGPDRASEIADLKVRIRDLEKEKQELETSNLKLERARRNAEVTLEKMQVEIELREEARSAGVVDTDYALDLLRRHAQKSPDAEIDPKSFFEGLKKDPTKRALFERSDVPAGPAPVGNQQPQQPQQQTQAPAQRPGEQLAPKPGEQPQKGEDLNVEGLSKRDFNKLTEQKYGFRPGY